MERINVKNLAEQWSGVEKAYYIMYSTATNTE